MVKRFIGKHLGVVSPLRVESASVLNFGAEPKAMATCRDQGEAESVLVLNFGAEPKAMATWHDQGEAESAPVLTLEPSRRQWRLVATKEKPRAFRC
ncbi:hypothetical protein BK131_27475 [Paenibacillus amylolyticus]|uniref:Uncharacterized protein n=1 Tax=Paenibacillus amylolyticus TaxID=1451 RepID=A0A1R1BHH8_PAEAM|nr:hypothetical protein BK131_27475 [Paenibacillus amylolyticus]